LAVLRFPVGEHRAGILRLVELADRRIDADLAEQGRHAEGARFVRDDRDDARPERRVFQDIGEEADDGDGGRARAAVGPKRPMRVRFERGHGDGGRVAPAPGQIAAERPAPLPQVHELRAVFSGTIEIEPLDLTIAERQAEPVAERLERLDVKLLGLMGDHAGFARPARAVALLGLGQDHSRAADCRPRLLEGGIELAKVMPATLE
jgi:hypothetical protein